VAKEDEDIGYGVIILHFARYMQPKLSFGLKQARVCIETYMAAYRLRNTEVMQEVVNVAYENDITKVIQWLPRIINCAKDLEKDLDPKTTPLANPPSKPSIPTFPRIVSSDQERYDTSNYFHYQPLGTQPIAPYR
jgi:hypothetical protein